MNPDKPYKSFETQRLLLEPTSPIDADFILELMNTPKWIKYVGDRELHNIEDARNYIETKMISQLTRLGYSNYTILRKSDQKKVGICGLYKREGLDGIDIGFALLPGAEKKGYAFEASKKIVNAAFTVFGLTKLYGITLRENLDSQQLLLKLGFTYLKDIMIPNDEEELMLFSLSHKKV